AEVTQPDLHERVEGLAQPREQGRDRGFVEASYPGCQVTDLHRAGVGDAETIYPGRPRHLIEAGGRTIRTGAEPHRALHKGADVGLQRIDVFGQHRLLDSRDQALVSQVYAFDLDPGRPLVEQIVKLSLGVFTDRLVRVEEAATAENTPVPAVHAVTG